MFSKSDNLGHTEGGVESDVSEDVDDHHQDYGDRDAPREVLDGILELLDDKVQVVPAVVSEEPRVEGERDLGEVSLGVLPGEVADIS